MSTDIKTVVLDWTDAINRHDPDAAAAFYAPDADFTDAGTGQRAQGRDAIRDAFKAFLAMSTDLAIEKTNMLSDGTWFATEWVMTGVHTGDIPGLPATGRSFHVVGAGVGEVRDGLIVHATEYWNMADLLGQVGALPAQAG
jgi:steroid delta-isomerase-like uncharacterized protein